MDKLLNFFCFPLLLLGLIFVGNGFVGYVEINAVDTKNNIKTANQINKLYSQKEITPSEKEISLKGPPITCLLYTSQSPRDRTRSRMPSSA